ncbi:MAG: aldo/keto reductase [Alistipes sp.]|nr:aldo/keto reductase [Alistipes sp.]
MTNALPGVSQNRDNTPFPWVTLNNGVEMPMIGFGTNTLGGERATNAVAEAIDVGFRLIDTATTYGNEAAVGEGIRQGIERSGIDREDLFITTKLWADDMGYEKAMAAFETSLEKLGLDYIDLWLIHRPRPHEDIPGSWRAMEELYAAGKIRAIGVSNFTPEQLDELLAYAKVKPAVDQIETHVFFQQFAAQRDLETKGIQMEAWSPLVAGNNLQGQQSKIFTNSVLVDIAKKHGKSTAQIALRWIIQRGIITIPRTTVRAEMQENLDIFDFELDADDMRRIATLDLDKTQFPHWN